MSEDPITKIKSHTFYGRRYKFIYDEPKDILSADDLAEIRKMSGLDEDTEILGATDDNRVSEKMMIVSDKLEAENPKELLRVLLDEAWHALDSTIDNTVVYEKAKDLCEFLWRCGYRRITS